MAGRLAEYEYVGTNIFISRETCLSARLLKFVWPSVVLKRAWRYRMLKLSRIKVSEHRRALGFAAGAFVSFTPFVGFHFILAAIMAFLLCGNIIASAVGTVVGNPVTFPAIWFGTYNVGALILGFTPKQTISMHSEFLLSGLSNHPLTAVVAVWDSIEPVLLPMCIGAIPLGLSCAVVLYVLVLEGLRGLHRPLPDQS